MSEETFYSIIYTSGVGPRIPEGQASEGAEFPRFVQPREMNRQSDLINTSGKALERRCARVTRTRVHSREGFWSAPDAVEYVLHNRKSKRQAGWCRPWKSNAPRQEIYGTRVALLTVSAT